MIPPPGATGYPGPYLEGIRLFNLGQFFQAHEAWEDLWRQSDGPERVFYQGLVQCAVALEHFRRGNLRGAAKLSVTYPTKFDRLAPVFMGIEIARLMSDMKRALSPAVEFQTARPAGSPPRLDVFPTIEVIDSPADPSPPPTPPAAGRRPEDTATRDRPAG